MDKDRQKKVDLLIDWLTEKKAEHIVSIDVSDRCSFTEHLLICSGTAPLHNKAIADHIVDKAREHKIKVLGKEGYQATTWILVDLNDVIVHIFTDENRHLYRLEDLWTTKNINEEALPTLKKEDIHK